MKTLLLVELYKLKRSKLILTATVLTLLALYQGYDFAKLGLSEKADEVFRDYLYQGSISMYSWLILPLISTVVVTMMARMEHSNNSWKQLLAMPVEKGKVYFAKLLVGMGIILYSLVLLFIGLEVASHLLGLETLSFLWLGKQLGTMYLSSFAIIGVIFYLSYKFSHFGVPMLVGAGLAFPSMLVANSEKYWIFYPWDYPIVSSLSYVFDMGGKNVVMLVVSLLLFVLAIGIGFVRFRTKDVL